MAQPAVAADVHQPLDVELNLTTQIALNTIFTINDLTNPADLLLSQVAHPRIGVDVRLLEDLRAVRAANAVDIANRNGDLLVSRDIYSANACHCISFL